MEDLFFERKIIIEMIVNTYYLDNIFQIIKPHHFEAETGKLLCAWILRFYKTNKKAPKQDIQLIYDSYVRRGKLDEDDVKDIKEILGSLNDEYKFSTKNENSDYFIDETINYLNQRELSIHQQKLAIKIEQGEFEEASELLINYKKIEKLTKVNCDFFNSDPKKTKKIFESIPQPLIEYPGKLGLLLNKHLVRGGFVGFLGPEKIGKTWILMDIAFQAQKCGKNVAFFAAGDMNKEEMELRKYVYLAKKSNEKEYCEKLFIPIADCWRSLFGKCQKKPWLSDNPPYNKETFPQKRKDYDHNFFFDKFQEYKDGYEPCTECKNDYKEFIPFFWFKEKESCEPLTWKEAYKHEQNYKKRIKSKFQFLDTPANTLTVDLIETQLQIWKNEIEFIPDVILIDYPDIMANQKQDFRHGENQKWLSLRALAHKWNCLIIAPTQAKSTAYKKVWLDETDYSEDKRKFAHTTAFFGLNQTNEEAEIGLFRINQLFVRSGKKGFKYATILQRLEIGRPHLGSF